MPEPIQTAITAVARAKFSAHAMVVAFGVVEAIWLYLGQQSLFTAWLSYHPWIPILHGALQAACVALAMYYPSLNRAA